jgi:cephalosporin-C deacetylase-like acetyl esterase
MTHVFTNTTVTKQGYAVVTCDVRGNHASQAPVLNQGVTSGTHMLNRLDERNYYTNGSGTV